MWFLIGVSVHSKSWFGGHRVFIVVGTSRFEFPSPSESHQGAAWDWHPLSLSAFFFFLRFCALPFGKFKLESYSAHSMFPLRQELSISPVVFLYNQRYCPSRGHLACSPPPQCKFALALTARCYERLYWSRPLAHKEIEKKSPWLRSPCR